MKGLPLRVKVALWSALAAGATMALALCGILYFIEHELLEIVDQRMDGAAREVFWDLDHHAGGPVENRTEITEDIMPPATSNRLVEITGHNGKLLYRSPSLGSQSIARANPNAREVIFGNMPYRLGTYYHKYLTLHLGSPLRNYYNTLNRVRLALLVSLPVVVILSYFGGLWVASRALRPVASLTAAADHITAEAFHQRLPLPTARDEIRQLTEVLNKTFARLETSYNQAVHFASDASHQLKTPIAVMRVGIDTLMKQSELRPEHIAELSELLQQTRRLASLADGLLLLARADAGRLQMRTYQTDLAPLIEGCLEDAEIFAEPRRIRIERDFPATLPAMADAPRTEQVLLNLLDNASKYNHDGGTITVTAGLDEEGAYIVVANTGYPIPGDKMPHIFNRFTRGETDESRTGHGLGLSIARELARAQGGGVRLLRSDAEITEFELRLPAVPPPSAQPAAPTSPVEVGERVLKLS